MKKIVGIIAALALASAVFADPDVAPVIASFDGNASLEWIADLDAETTGMKNSEAANFKVKFISEGTKETSGDGLWGELKIKAGSTEVESKLGDAAASSGVAVAIPSVETAVIHFVDDDFYAKMNIKVPGLSVGGGDIITATSSKKGYPSKSVTLNGKQGFTLSFGIPAVDFNLQFADNGQQKSDAKKFAFVFDATVKAIENLSIYAGVGYSTEEIAGKAQDAAIAAKVTYTLSDIGDGMYLKPGVGFAMQGDAKDLGVGILFGWGTEEQEPNFAGFSNGVTNVPNKCADGVSIYLNSTLADNAPMGFLFSAYDSKFLADFGIKIGAQLAVADLANFGKVAGDAFDFALSYGSGDTFGDWKVAANLGAKFRLDTSKFGMLYGASVTNSAIIQNTDLYVKYSGEHAAEISGADKKGAVTLGAKIHF